MVLDKDYDVLGPLGEGAFGKVYKAQTKASGELVAVKQIKLGSRSWEEACRSTELQALKALRHPFIVRLRELIRSQRDGSLYYIFEFVDSDLRRLLGQYPTGLEESYAAELSRQLFAGLAHMHQHNFFHRDIKPENILFDTDKNTIRIADLGQARSLRARPPFTDYVGTRWYRAPECLLRDRSYSSPVDVWAAGLILAELLRGSPLFCGTSAIDQLYKIFTVIGPPLQSDWPDYVRLSQQTHFRLPQPVSPYGLERVLPRTSPQAPALLTEALMLNPRRRPLARKCLDHAFFAHLPALDIDNLDTHRSRCSVPGSPEGQHRILERKSTKQVESTSFDDDNRSGSNGLSSGNSSGAEDKFGELIGTETEKDIEKDFNFTSVLQAMENEKDKEGEAANLEGSGQGVLTPRGPFPRAPSRADVEEVIAVDLEEFDAELDKILGRESPRAEDINPASPSPLGSLS